MSGISDHTTDKTIPSRIARLRALMDREGITMAMIPTSDYHASEYVGDHFKFREYLSGFTGSNGTLVVTRDEAGLWTDGRYFIQAEIELSGSGIKLFKEREPGVPTVKEYIKSHISSGDRFYADARLISSFEGEAVSQILREAGAEFKTEPDLADEVWENRPAVDPAPVFALDEGVSGEPVSDKLDRVRKAVSDAGADILILTALDDVCYLTDIRGADIACTPVVYSYMYITADEAAIFLYESAVSEKVRSHLTHAGIDIRPYDEFDAFIREKAASYSSEDRVFIDLKSANYGIANTVKNSKAHIIDKLPPTREMEAVRNEIQLNNIRKVYELDSAVLTRFLFKMKNRAGSEDMDEYSVSLELDEMRSKIEGFIGLSFDTISAYGPNAAMMHYEATADSFSEIRPEGMYLVDSGGQYMGGTTDVTRTIALGPVTDEMKRDFTLVCVGMLRLADAVFLEGCSGRNLDILAREPLWRKRVDYKCGTGHGVGFMLGVHTGPQGIRPRFSESTTEIPLKAGMTLSDEPGVYIEGSYGIRTENILEVVDAGTSPDGHFLTFAHLTWVPIDLDLIDTSYMDERDIKLLNDYHAGVYERLVSHMVSDEEKKWLKNATRAL